MQCTTHIGRTPCNRFLLHYTPTRTLHFNLGYIYKSFLLMNLIVFAFCNKIIITFWTQHSQSSTKIQFHDAYQNHHPLSAALGIISPQLQQFLIPSPTSTQLPPHLHRSYAKTQSTQLMQIRTPVLTTTYNCFTTWQRY